MNNIRLQETSSSLIPHVDIDKTCNRVALDSSALLMIGLSLHGTAAGIAKVNQAIGQH